MNSTVSATQGSNSTRSADDAALAELWCRNGDRRARDQLIERLLPLVHSIARRYAHRGEALDDLVQAGSVGLVKAVDRFDPDRGVMLSTFAVPNIAGEIKRYFRDATRTIRVPRDVQELKADLTKATDHLIAIEGRFPTVEELAEAVDADVEQVVEALQSSHAYRPDSLNEPIGEDEEAQALIGETDEAFGTAEERMTLGTEARVLDDREREILRMRFTEDMTQSEIADRIGISQMHVSRLLSRALGRLRGRLEVSEAV